MGLCVTFALCWKPAVATTVALCLWSRGTETRHSKMCMKYDSLECGGKSDPSPSQRNP